MGCCWGLGSREAGLAIRCEACSGEVQASAATVQPEYAPIHRPVTAGSLVASMNVLTTAGFTASVLSMSCVPLHSSETVASAATFTALYIYIYSALHHVVFHGVAAVSMACWHVLLYQPQCMCMEGSSCSALSARTQASLHVKLIMGHVHGVKCNLDTHWWLEACALQTHLLKGA
jgi:hypothetical protein